LVLPALRVFPRWRLAADVAWGPTRARQRFRIAGEGRPAPEPEDTADLPEEAARLVERWDALGSAWRVGPASKLVDLPGVGLAVTDLVFTHRETGRQVYLEMLGFWSREAVWRRVDLAQAGAGVPIVFAVSERLRVSEQVLDDQVPAALYVYKGALSPRAVLARVEEVASRCAS
jgi:predicted nuclease of restriction endonuclease-like RecB superfamily